MQNKRSILTHTGKLFDFWEPTPDTICIEDIAHALALTNRYGGHTYQPYSVAEHCERMSYLPGDPLVNLLHDADEAYVGDIASPQKRYLCWHEDELKRCFRNQEDRILKVIGVALGVAGLEKREGHSDVKKADLTMLATETRDLMPSSVIYSWWIRELEPLEEIIYPMSWELAEDQFLARFDELTGE